MGGKTKQTQRTKNNTRPSNSGRSAELLGTGGSTFVGFGAHADYGLVAMVPGFSTFENLPDTFDATLPVEFQFVLRKMSKKDPVTKVKALQEFCDMIKNSDIKDLKTVLPWWPKFYQNLANDTDHKVRASAQQAQAALASKAGKKIALYLKQLAPIWIASQFDSYAPVASIAINSFKSMFANKVQEVYSFCQNEILDYVTNNLTVHTISTLCNPKTHTEEESENKYNRIIVCTLHTYATYFEKTTSEQIKELATKNETILQNQKFWSYAKHKSSEIRSSWFLAISAGLENASFLFENYKQQVINIVFQNLDENNILVLPKIWAAIFIVQQNYPDWYTIVNFRKVLKPKLFNVIKYGINGTATISFPHLLPFISKLSEEQIEDFSKVEFFKDFFDAMKMPLVSQVAEPLNKSNLSTIVTTFYECLRYVIQQMALPESKEYTDSIRDFSEMCLQNYIIDVLQYNIINENYISKQIFLHISKLVSHFTQNSGSSKLYDNMLSLFWSKLLQLIIENFENDDTNMIRSEKIIEFIQHMYHASPKLYDAKVKFATDQSSNVVKEISDKPDIILQRNLKEIVVVLGQKYIKKISQSKKSNYVIQLKNLCKLINDGNFYLQLTNDNNVTSILKLLIDWLENDELVSESIIDIIFDIIAALPKNEWTNHINNMFLLKNVNSQEWILNRLMSYPLCLEPEIRPILSQEHVSFMILRIARDVLKENSKEKFNLLHKCFFQIDSGEILISKSTVDGILNIMAEPLTDDSMLDMLDTCGSFIAQIMPVICSDNASKYMQNEMFLKLFKFSIWRKENDDLSEDTLWEITTCWQDALSSNDITLNDDILKLCSTAITERLMANEDFTSKDIETVADMTAQLISCSSKDIKITKEYEQCLDKKICALLDDSTHIIDVQRVIDVCIYLQSLQGSVSVTNSKDSLDYILPSDLEKFFIKHFFNISAVFKLARILKEEQESQTESLYNREDDYTEEKIGPLDKVVKSIDLPTETFLYRILSAMQVASLGEIMMLNSYTDNENIETTLCNIYETVRNILDSVSENTLKLIKATLFTNIALEPMSFGRVVLILFPEDKTEQNLEKKLSLIDEFSTVYFCEEQYTTFVNMLQILIKHLPSKHLQQSAFKIGTDDILIKIIYARCLILNTLTGVDYNEYTDKEVIAQCLSVLDDCATKKEDFNKLCYNCDITTVECAVVTTVVELANLICEIIIHFPTELTLKQWDFIRISLSSWVLSVSKCYQHYKYTKANIFIAAIYKLNSTLNQFINAQKTKSSSKMLGDVIEEWQNLFSREVNLVLFKSYITLILSIENTDAVKYKPLLDTISPYLEDLDFPIIFEACQKGFKISTDEVFKFALENLANENYRVSVASLNILNKFASFSTTIDLQNLEKRNELTEQQYRHIGNTDEWHLLYKFKEYLEKYGQLIEPYSKDFNYKLTDLANLESIPAKFGYPYLFIWDCLIQICTNASPELRSNYASFVTEFEFEQVYLHFLIRSMPIEILKNHDTKLMSNDMFKPVTWKQIKDHQISIERYACHAYTQMLRHLPAVVRRWWNAANPRQKAFVDKLTTNFVSGYICNEELKSITSKKSIYDNMQVTVHTSTREVIATYSIDDVRMELVISLAANHPLGPVKVENVKQILGRVQARVVVMQLTIFLTHQNGSIFDGLSLWKKNLDQKFEGVEECYICYSVIHQDTCQLPKLTCKTCKKKFHGRCLYKWFTTSSKSTCPICRNVF